MSLYKYRVFETVAKEESFLKAANVLNLTPSAVSHAIAKLENEFGFALFIRDRARVEITQEGEKILPIIGSILRSEDALNQEIARFNGMKTGVLRIGTLETVTRKWFPDIMRTFNQKFPEIEVKILEGTNEDIARWVKTSQVDISFISIISAEDMPEFTILPLHRDEMFCVVPREAAAENREYVTFQELQGQSVILLLENDDSDISIILRKHGIEPTQPMRMQTYDSVITMIRCGFGMGLVAGMACKLCDLSNVNVYRFEPREYRTIGLIVTNEKMPSRAVVEFKKVVDAFLAGHGLNNV